MIYDLVIVGAGPAGLMAAKTAAEQGLTVLLAEKRKNVGRVTRACSMQFVLDEGYENECVRVEEDKVIFPKNGFEIEYDGIRRGLTDKHYVSPGGRRIHFSNNDGSYFAVKFDKGRLLEGLWQRCAKVGVVQRPGTLVYDLEDQGSHVDVRLSSKTGKTMVQARKVIAADGVNSRVAAASGLNDDRKLFATVRCLIYEIEGIKDFHPRKWNTYMGAGYGSTIGVIVAPSLHGESVAEVVIMGSNKRPPEAVFEEVSKRGLLAPLFEGTTVVSKTGCGVKAFAPLRVPHRGNIIVIGDGAAYVEVETQGALMCGFRAAQAVAEELQGEPGFGGYTTWWQDSFEFNSDEYLMVAQGYALVPTYNDDELDYLFALTEDETLQGTYSQYKSPKLMWGSILRHRQRIAKERPEIFAKIERNNSLTFEGLLD